MPCYLTRPGIYLRGSLRKQGCVIATPRRHPPNISQLDILHKSLMQLYLHKSRQDRPRNFRLANIVPHCLWAQGKTELMLAPPCIAEHELSHL